jgi:hypothetical protein
MSNQGYAIRKVDSLFIVSTPTQEQKLFLVGSVAYFNGKLLPEYVRWKCQDDSSTVKALIQSALDNPSEETIKALLVMESFYKELQGTAPANATAIQVAQINDAKNSADKDLFRSGFLNDVSIESVESEGSMITLGELVDAKRRADGAARNSFRKKPKT